MTELLCRIICQRDILKIINLWGIKVFLSFIDFFRLRELTLVFLAMFVCHWKDHNIILKMDKYQLLVLLHTYLPKFLLCVLLKRCVNLRPDISIVKLQLLYTTVFKINEDLFWYFKNVTDSDLPTNLHTFLNFKQCFFFQTSDCLWLEKEA